MRKELITERDDIFVVHDFLSSDQCSQYIGLSESAGYGDAPINALGGPVINKKVRNNDRVIIDDIESAQELWLQLQPHMPEQTGMWRPIGLNERFRYYRYQVGQQFDWHFDGCFERSPFEKSRFTLMVYLNDGCTGGQTEFNLRLHGSCRDDDPIVCVRPETGKALVFVHRVLHRGAPVSEGKKYVLRSDVMCRWTSQ